MGRATITGGAMLGLAALAIFAGEKKRPLRGATQPVARRAAINVALGAIATATMAAVEGPGSRALARRAERRRAGLAQRVPGGPLMRDAAAVLLLDYTIYLWHVATHKIPFLWRLHLVHHVDLDLDSTTALRFHAADMVVSAPVRWAQVLVAGASPRALAVWQGWFFFSVLFHHSDLRLPERWERRLAWLVTTPRMHGIHHSAVRDRTDSNWSSGFSVWDRLHGTFRLDVPQERDRMGVPAYRDPAELGLRRSLVMPFGRERDAWKPLTA